MIYANKVNGYSYDGEHLSSTLDYIVITSTINFLMGTSVGGSAASQVVLDKIVEVVSQRGQPVIMAAPYVDTVTGNYVLKLAIEHAGQWTAADLGAHLVADQEAGSGLTSANLSVNIASGARGSSWGASF